MVLRVVLRQVVLHAYSRGTALHIAPPIAIHVAPPFAPHVEPLVGLHIFTHVGPNSRHVYRLASPPVAPCISLRIAPSPRVTPCVALCIYPRTFSHVAPSVASHFGPFSDHRVAPNSQLCFVVAQIHINAMTKFREEGRCR
jgi:hypothetical protein